MAEMLRDDVDGLGVLCADAADWYAENRGAAVSPLIIEKDFWITEVLRAISEPQTFPAPNRKTCDVTVRAVFKGGTSLSKAFGLIQRFSEDADVYLHIEPAEAANLDGFTLGNNRIDSIMKTTADRIGAIIGVEASPEGIARSGTKRGYVYKHPRPTDAPESAFKEGVLLELVRMGTPTPNAAHQVQSMLSAWVAQTGRMPLSDFDELSPFFIDVLRPERTLVDKLCILHGLGTEIAAGRDARVQYQTRHYYDVHRMLASQSVLQSLRADPGIVAAYAKTAEENHERLFVADDDRSRLTTQMQDLAQRVVAVLQYLDAHPQRATSTERPAKQRWRGPAASVHPGLTLTTAGRDSPLNWMRERRPASMSALSCPGRRRGSPPVRWHHHLPSLHPRQRSSPPGGHNNRHRRQHLQFAAAGYRPPRR